MSKSKTLIEEIGTRYLKQVPWSPQQTILHHRLCLSVPHTGALITSADNSWPPPLPFHTALKFLSRTYSRFLIHMPVCVSVSESVCVCVCVCVCLWVSVCLCEWVCLWWWAMLIKRECSAKEFLELYGKVEAVVRNCLLRWSEQLVEVTGITLFGQFF